MKKTISILISLALLISFLPIQTFAMTGSGTESNPYLVSSASDINNIHNDLSGYYKLTCDIDMSGVDFEPIGNESEGAFTGTIDGNGYTISNLNLDLPGNKYVGFVGYLEGNIKNIYFNNAIICGYKYIGIVAAYTSKIANIYKVGNYNGNIQGLSQISESTICTGGLVGYNNGNIDNSFNKAVIYSDWSAGGISGTNDGNISNCKNYGTINALHIGGISFDGIGNISNATNFGDLNYGYKIGGICCESTNIENCVNYGNIVGGTRGGYSTDLYGVGNCESYRNNYKGRIFNCINYGNIEFESSDYYSCVISGIGNGIIEKCINFGDLKLVTQTRNSYLSSVQGNIYGISCAGYYTKITDSINYGTLFNGSIGDNASSCSLKGNSFIYNSINIGLTDLNKNDLSMLYYCVNDNYFMIYSNNSNMGNVNPIYYNKTYSRNDFNTFDFENIWEIDNKINNGFPFLKNLPRHIDLNKNVVFLETGDIDALSAYIKSSPEAVSWKSSNDAVASISSNGALKANSLGYCTITATNSEGMKAKCHVYVYQRADSTEFTQNNLTTSIDKTVQAELKQYPSTANEAIIWSSNNENIAMVSASGLITGKKSGTAIITATTANSNKTASCIVTVTGKPVTSLNISKSAVNMNINNIAQLTVDVTPSDYQGKIEWSSSNADIAAVDDIGLITAKYPGICYIYAKAESGITAQCTVTVKAPATEIKLNKTELNLQKGLTERLEANLTPTYSTDEIKWTTSNSNIAAVSNDGTVTAKSVGQVIISAITTSGEKAYCTVNITENPIAVSSVTLNKTSAVLTSADKIQLNATVLPENATDKSIVWKSSDEAVAKVSNTGVVTAVSPGNATITATSNNGYYHECNIDVVAANGSAFIAKSAKASAGEIAEYTVSVVKNPGISSYKLNLDYDSSLLTPIEIVKNPQISGSLSSNLKDEERSTLNVIWYSTDDFTENADLFTIKFKVADNAEYGTEIPITMSSGASDIKNSSGKKLAFFMNNTSIKVEKPLLGDIFEDGEIDFRDLNLLARNVSGLESLSQRQLLAADTEQDKVIDTKDTVRLLQHLTGWTGADLIYTFAMNNGVASVKVGSTSINAANEAEIPVSIENNPGVAGFRFELDYDKNALDILSITPDDSISENFMTNLGTDEKLYVSWYNAENINTDGALFTIKVKYKDECDKQVTPISIVAADNNMCNQKREDVIAEYEMGYLMTDSFVKENESIENGTYSAELYFDNSYEEKSAVAILALYNKNGQFLGLSSKDITVKPGRVDLSLDYDDADYFNYKLLIWEDMSNLKPLTGVK